MLLQQVNEHCRVGLLAHQVSEKSLVRRIGQQNIGLVRALEKLQDLQDGSTSASDPEYGWYVRLMRYRNAASHRCVLYPWPRYWYIPGTAHHSTVYLMADPDDPTKGPYEDYDLIDFFIRARADMETALARWAADLGLTTSPAQ
jgi:hypothetical protein